MKAGADGTNEGAELLTGSVLLFVSGFFAYHSLALERPEGWGTAPGLLPLVLSVSLFAMAGVICAGCIRRGALRRLFAGPDADAPAPGFFARYWRALVAAGAIAVFYFVLLKLLPFEIAAVLFFAFMTQIFWQSASWKRRLTVSVCMPFLVSAVFQGGFAIPLPGEGNLIEALVYALRH